MLRLIRVRLTVARHPPPATRHPPPATRHPPPATRQKPARHLSITFILLTLLFVAVSVAMILIILVQRPQGGGLAGAFGGAGGGGTDTAFGGRTGDALTWATVGAFSAFIILGAVINIIGNPRAVAETLDGAGGVVSPDLVETPAGTGTGTAPDELGGTLGSPATDAPRQPPAEIEFTIPPTTDDELDGNLDADGAESDRGDAEAGAIDPNG